MPDKKISEDALVTGSFLDMYLPVVDDSEVLAENRNKRITLETIIGAVTSFSGTTLTVSLLAPQLYYFNGSATSTVTLPAGSDAIINIPIAFINKGTGSAELNIEGNGSDVIIGSDPFNIPNGDFTQYVFKWNGTNWAVN